MKKLISVLLALCLILGLAACGNTPVSTAESSGTGSESASESSSDSTEPTGPKETYPLIAEQTDLEAIAVSSEHFSFTKGEIAYFFAITFKDYYQYFSYFGIDETKSLKEQKYSDEKTWFDVLMDEALNYARNYLLFSEAAYDRGLRLDSTEEAYIASQKAQIEADAAQYGWDADTYLGQLFGTNITWAILEAAMQKMLLADKGYEAFNDELKAAISEEDIRAAYEADRKSFDYIDYVDIDFLDAETLSEEDKAELAKAFSEARDEAAFTKAVILFVDKTVDEEKIKEAGSSLKYAENLMASKTAKMQHYVENELMEWAFGEDRDGDVYVQAEESEGARHAVLLKKAPYRDDSTYVSVRHILFLTQSAGSAEAARAKAEEAYAEWQAGDKTEDSFAEMAIKLSEDGGSASNGGIYEFFGRGEMVEPFEDWSFDPARQRGDTGIVDTTYGSHIMYFLESDVGWHLDVLDYLMDEAYSEAVQELDERHPIEKADEVLNAINW